MISLAIFYEDRGVPRGVLRVLEHPHQKKKSSCSIGLTITALELLAREVTHTATNLQLMHLSMSSPTYHTPGICGDWVGIRHFW